MVSFPLRLGVSRQQAREGGPPVLFPPFHPAEFSPRALLRSPKPFVAAAILAFALAFLAAPAFPSATASHVAFACPTPPSAPFTFADFDGDRLPDLASVGPGGGDSSTARYWIAFQFSRGPRSGIAISAPSGGLQISSRDVNGDGFPDVVVSTRWTRHPVAVLLNDGRGNFRVLLPQEYPEAFASPAEVWAAPDYRRPDLSPALFSGSRSWTADLPATLPSHRFDRAPGKSAPSRLFASPSLHTLSARAPPSHLLSA